MIDGEGEFISGWMKSGLRNGSAEIRLGGSHVLAGVNVPQSRCLVVSAKQEVVAIRAEEHRLLLSAHGESAADRIAKYAERFYSRFGSDRGNGRNPACDIGDG